MNTSIGKAIFSLGIVGLIYCLSFYSANLYANENLEKKSFTIGHYETIKSTVLNEQREFIIALPKDYDETDHKYPVLYLTDAEALFQTVASTVQHLSNNSVIPPMIVVGLNSGYTRTRDLTPYIAPEKVDESAWYASQSPGGASNTIRFFETELKPFINAQYRTADFSLFSGHSLGGLFGLHVLLAQPDVFDAYITISSSLWWDDEAQVKELKQQVKSNKFPHKLVFISKADEEGPIETGYQEVTKLLSEYSPKTFSAMPFPNENHLTVPFQAHYFGLKAIFSEWDLPFEKGAEGLETVKQHIKKTQSLYNIKFIDKAWLINLGNSEMYKKRYDKAIEVFEYTTELLPNYAYGHFLLASAHESKNELSVALSFYEKANNLVADSHSSKQFYQDNLDRIKNLM